MINNNLIKNFLKSQNNKSNNINLHRKKMKQEAILNLLYLKNEDKLKKFKKEAGSQK